MTANRTPDPAFDPVMDSAPLGFPWPAMDPFLFCAYHNDDYPAGTDALGPDPQLLAGRKLGMDFTVKDGFRMYHGHTVPGFPAHPHRGFETVTLVRKGYCDHSDSLGATARFGAGDAQWLTAGKGIVHSEMFPLLSKDAPNPLELFQIWLNLSREKKMAEPHFSIFWSQDIPVVTQRDEKGREARVTLVAGSLGETRGVTPPPESWASDPENEVGIWMIALEAECEWVLPEAGPNVGRTLYFFDGDELSLGPRHLHEHTVAIVDPTRPAVLRAKGPVQILVLQGRPLNEPVAHHGPFVMNTRKELEQAFTDYQKTRFGGWPWSDEAPHLGPTEGRFARHPDGTEQRFPLKPLP